MFFFKCSLTRGNWAQMSGKEALDDVQTIWKFWDHTNRIYCCFIWNPGAVAQIKIRVVYLTEAPKNVCFEKIHWFPSKHQPFLQNWPHTSHKWSYGVVFINRYPWVFFHPTKSGVMGPLRQQLVFQASRSSACFASSSTGGGGMEE